AWQSDRARRAVDAERAATARERDAKEQARREAEERATAERRAKEDEAAERHQAQGMGAGTPACSEVLGQGILAVARPAGERGGLGVDVTVKRALDEAVGKVAERFRDRPRAEAVARHDLGVTFRLVGEPARAVGQLERAVALRRQALGVD